MSHRIGLITQRSRVQIPPPQPTDRHDEVACFGRPFVCWAAASIAARFPFRSIRSLALLRHQDDRIDQPSQHFRRFHARVLALERLRKLLDLRTVEVGDAGCSSGGGSSAAASCARSASSRALRATRGERLYIRAWDRWAGEWRTTPPQTNEIKRRLMLPAVKRMRWSSAGLSEWTAAPGARCRHAGLKDRRNLQPRASQCPSSGPDTPAGTSSTALRLKNSSCLIRPCFSDRSRVSRKRARARTSSRFLGPWPI